MQLDIKLPSDRTEFLENLLCLSILKIVVVSKSVNHDCNFFIAVNSRYFKFNRFFYQFYCFGMHKLYIF